MERKIGATEARIRFGELIRRVVEDGEGVIVERGGKPCVVVSPIEQYRRMKAASGGEDEDDLVERVGLARRRILKRRGD
ncbi:MAG: type II toxin-antitoxin system Phd/YefM family antitoxin, partial [Deltaproteobacteria bacterium]